MKNILLSSFILLGLFNTNFLLAQSEAKKINSEGIRQGHNHRIARQNPQNHEQHGDRDEHDHGKHGDKDENNHGAHGDKDEHDHGKHGDKDEHDHHEHDHESHGHEDEHKESFGKSKAIQQVELEGKKFKLSKEAIKSLNIASENISPQKQLGSKKYWLPHSALVFSKNNVAIFSRDDNWFEFHSVSILQKKKSPDLTLVELPYLVSKLNVVVEGVPLLMVARLQATGKGGKGHVH